MCKDIPAFIPRKGQNLFAFVCFPFAFLFIDASPSGPSDVFDRWRENKWNMFSVCLARFFGTPAMAFAFPEDGTAALPITLKAAFLMLDMLSSLTACLYIYKNIRS